MQIQEIMKKEVQTCTPETTVRAAVKQMAEHDIGSLIVTQAGQPVGIFTERDLIKRVVAPGQDLDELKIGTVMTPDPIAVKINDSIGSVHHLLIEKGVRHAPVIQEGKLVGIISQKDISRVLDTQFYSMYFQSHDSSGAY